MLDFTLDKRYICSIAVAGLVSESNHCPSSTRGASLCQSPQPGHGRERTSLYFLPAVFDRVLGRNKTRRNIECSLTSGQRLHVTTQPQSIIGLITELGIWGSELLLGCNPLGLAELKGRRQLSLNLANS